MTKISLADVEKIAALCRLSFTDAEKELMTEQLSSIVAYVEKLAEVPTEEVEPTHHVSDQTDALRDDFIIPDDHTDALLGSIPERDGRAVKVKTVFGV